MLKKIAYTIAVVACVVSAGSRTRMAAQEQPVPPKPPAAAKSAPEPPALPINIKIEVAITDQAGATPPARKIVTMIASDRQNANVRSTGSVPVKIGGPTPLQSYSYETVTINVDARPVIVAKEPNKISLTFGLEYLPKTVNAQEETERGTTWSQRLGLVLESGKPMIISQSADPTSDRKITVEVTATILR
jgi:hypothetical protein